MTYRSFVASYFPWLKLFYSSVYRGEGAEKCSPLTPQVQTRHGRCSRGRGGGEMDRMPSEYCWVTVEQGTELPNACTRPCNELVSDICSWDRLQQPPHDPIKCSEEISFHFCFYVIISLIFLYLINQYFSVLRLCTAHVLHLQLLCVLHNAHWHDSVFCRKKEIWTLRHDRQKSSWKFAGCLSVHQSVCPSALSHMSAKFHKCGLSHFEAFWVLRVTSVPSCIDLTSTRLGWRQTDRHLGIRQKDGPREETCLHANEASAVSDTTLGGRLSKAQGTVGGFFPSIGRLYFPHEWKLDNVICHRVPGLQRISRNRKWNVALCLLWAGLRRWASESCPKVGW